MPRIAKAFLALTAVGMLSAFKPSERPIPCHSYAYCHPTLNYCRATTENSLCTGENIYPEFGGGESFGGCMQGCYVE